jgi:hypothetical protein
MLLQNIIHNNKYVKFALMYTWISVLRYVLYTWVILFYFVIIKYNSIFFNLKARKILHLHTTYVNKNNSNKFIYQRVNEIIGTPFQGPLRKIRPLTEILETKHLKLLGHVLRRPQSYPQHHVTFTSYLGLPKTPSNRRVGRPRKKWLLKTWNWLGTYWRLIIMDYQTSILIIEP